MARSIEEIQADIARVKAEMALRDKYERGFNQPQTKVGWGSYIVNGDRGLLDAYQNRENQWKNMQEQQAYQSAERALQQKFQEEEARKNRDLQERIARMNRTSANEDKREEARLQMQRLILQRSKMQEQGMNTGDLDLQIKHLADKYDFETAPEAEYDINKDPEYVLAMYDDLDYTDDLEDPKSHKLEDARKELINFRTPAVVKRIAKLDKEIIKRDKHRALNAQVQADIKNYFVNKKHPISDLLVELGYEESGHAGNRSLILGGKKTIRNEYTKNLGNDESWD